MIKEIAALWGQTSRICTVEVWVVMRWKGAIKVLVVFITGSQYIHDFVPTGDWI